MKTYGNDRAKTFGISSSLIDAVNKVTSGQPIEEETPEEESKPEQLDESMSMHVRPHKNGTHHVVMKVGKALGHHGGAKVGEKLSDTEIDDAKDSGIKVHHLPDSATVKKELAARVIKLPSGALTTKLKNEEIEIEEGKIAGSIRWVRGWKAKGVSKEDAHKRAKELDIHPKVVDDHYKEDIDETTGPGWWKTKPDEHMSKAYWQHSKIPPIDKKIKHDNYQKIVKSLHKRNPAPKQEYDKHMNHYAEGVLDYAKDVVGAVKDVVKHTKKHGLNKPMTRDPSPSNYMRKRTGKKQDVDESGMGRVAYQKQSGEPGTGLETFRKKPARQMKDPKKETMVHHPDHGVRVIDKKDENKHLKKGWVRAESVEVDEAVKHLPVPPDAPRGHGVPYSHPERIGYDGKHNQQVYNSIVHGGPSDQINTVKHFARTGMKGKELHKAVAKQHGVLHVGVHKQLDHDKKTLHPLHNSFEIDFEDLDLLDEGFQDAIDNAMRTLDSFTFKQRYGHSKAEMRKRLQGVSAMGGRKVRREDVSHPEFGKGMLIEIHDDERLSVMFGDGIKEVHLDDIDEWYIDGESVALPLSEKKKKKLDNVDTKGLEGSWDTRDDKDIDNDGDEDQSDKYLHKRRKKIKKSMKEWAQDTIIGKMIENPSRSAADAYQLATHYYNLSKGIDEELLDKAATLYNTFLEMDQGENPVFRFEPMDKVLEARKGGGAEVGETERSGHRVTKTEKEGPEHIAMQLRKVGSLKGQHSGVDFNDGSKTKVNPSHASAALTRYDAAKPSEKEELQKHMAHSHDALKHVASGKPLHSSPAAEKKSGLGIKGSGRLEPTRDLVHPAQDKRPR